MANSGGICGEHSVSGLRLGELNGAHALELFRFRPHKGMTAAQQFVERHAHGEDIALHAGLPGHELLRRHVRNGAAARRVGLAHLAFRWILARLGWIELRLRRRESPGQAKVQNLDHAAIGQHHVGGLQIAMENPQLVRRA